MKKDKQFVAYEKLVQYYSFAIGFCWKLELVYNNKYAIEYWVYNTGTLYLIGHNEDQRMFTVILL